MITITRGDTVPFTIMARQSGGFVPFADGDTVYFTVKIAATSEKILLQKIMTVFEDGVARFTLLPKDLKPLSFGDYVFDVQLTAADGTVTTIIKPDVFRVAPEVTYD